MNQEDMLVLLVVFVLGFVVSRMMSGRLVEGGFLHDIGHDIGDVGDHIGDGIKDFGNRIGDDTSNIFHNRGDDYGKTCTKQGDCTKVCAFSGQHKCFIVGTQDACDGKSNCKCYCD